MRKIEFLSYPTSNSRSIRFNAGQKTRVEVLRYWAFSCLYLYDDADNMFFDEIHNKRLLQIMPLNTSLSLLSILSPVWKSHLSSSESLRTPPDLFNRRHDNSLLEAPTWERATRSNHCIGYQKQRRLAACRYLSSSCSLRIPLDERLVPVSRLDYQNIILCARARASCLLLSNEDDDGNIPASKEIEMILNLQTREARRPSLDHDVGRLRFCIFTRERRETERND